MAKPDDPSPSHADPHARTQISGADLESHPRDDDEDASFVGIMIADRYRVETVIGRGGMGTVYLAEHVQLKRRVALKMLSNEFRLQPHLAARFLTEARAAAQIGHPNIVDVFDLGELPEGGAYIAMALLHGCDLQTELRRTGAMPFSRVREIIGPVCRALAAAHGKGITHRDMKPANIFLSRDADDVETVKLLDFGVAQVRDNDLGPTDRTREGDILGTPAFMSPEQGSGRNVDHRADIYAVGCILYNLLTNQHVFDAPNVMAVITRHMFEPPIPPSLRAPDARIGREIDGVVLRALAKNPADRYQTMKDLWVALEALGPSPALWPEETSGRYISVRDLPVRPAPVETPQAATSTLDVRRRSPSVGLIAVGALLCAAVGGGAWWAHHRAVAPSAPVVAAASDVDFDVTASQPGATLTFRGRVYPLPLHARLARGAQPEAAEVAAPGFVPSRTWVTLDRGRALDVALATEAPLALPGAQGHASHHAKTEHVARETPEAPVTPTADVARTASPPVEATPPAPPVAPAPQPAPPTHPIALPPSQPLVLAERVIAQQVHAHRAAVDSCIAEDPSASGKLAYRVTIAPGGKIERAQLVDAERRFPSVEACLSRAITTWTVSPPPGRAAESRFSIDLE